MKTGRQQGSDPLGDEQRPRDTWGMSIPAKGPEGQRAWSRVSYGERRNDRAVTRGGVAEGPDGQYEDLGFYSASDEKSLESFGQRHDTSHPIGQLTEV